MVEGVPGVSLSYLLCFMMETQKDLDMVYYLRDKEISINLLRKEIRTKE